jgi:hypothetical protein
MFNGGHLVVRLLSDVVGALLSHGLRLFTQHQVIHYEDSFRTILTRHDLLKLRGDR